MERLEAIKARLAAATPGPWEAWYDSVNDFGARDGCMSFEWMPNGRGEGMNERAEADAVLIAHAPADLAFLLAEVERLRADAARVELFARHVHSLSAEGRITASDGLPAVWALDWPNPWDDDPTDDDFRAWVDARIAEHRAVANAAAPPAPAPQGESPNWLGSRIADLAARDFTRVNDSRTLPPAPAPAGDARAREDSGRVQRDMDNWLNASCDEIARLRAALDAARDAALDFALDFALDDAAALARVVAIIDAAYPQGTPARAGGETV